MIILKRDITLEFISSTSDYIDAKEFSNPYKSVYVLNKEPLVNFCLFKGRPLCYVKSLPFNRRSSAYQYKLKALCEITSEHKHPVYTNMFN